MLEVAGGSIPSNAFWHLRPRTMSGRRRRGPGRATAQSNGAVLRAPGQKSPQWRVPDRAASEVERMRLTQKGGAGEGPRRQRPGRSLGRTAAPLRWRRAFGAHQGPWSPLERGVGTRVISAPLVAALERAGGMTRLADAPRHGAEGDPERGAGERVEGWFATFQESPRPPLRRQADCSFLLRNCRRGRGPSS